MFDKNLKFKKEVFMIFFSIRCDDIDIIICYFILFILLCKHLYTYYFMFIKPNIQYIFVLQCNWRDGPAKLGESAPTTTFHLWLEKKMDWVISTFKEITKES